jgi:hypothetical protein
MNNSGVVVVTIILTGLAMVIVWDVEAQARRRGWEQAMRERGCGIMARGYSAPFGFDIEQPNERGWVCSGSGKVHYFDSGSR